MTEILRDDSIEIVASVIHEAEKEVSQEERQHQPEDEQRREEQQREDQQQQQPSSDIFVSTNVVNESEAELDGGDDDGVTTDLIHVSRDYSGAASENVVASAETVVASAVDVVASTERVESVAPAEEEVAPTESEVASAEAAFAPAEEEVASAVEVVAPWEVTSEAVTVTSALENATVEDAATDEVVAATAAAATTANDAPVNDAPANDAPADVAPANDAAADVAPAVDAPANDAPDVSTTVAEEETSSSVKSSTLASTDVAENSGANGAIFVDCPEALLEIQKMDLVDAIQNNRRLMRRSVSLTVASAAAATASTPPDVVANGHAAPTAQPPASPSASDGASSPCSTNGALSPRNGATSPDSGINMEGTGDPLNDSQGQTKSTGNQGQANRGQSETTANGEKGISEAEKERQEFIKSQIVRRRKSEILPYTQALPTEERLAVEKQKTTEALVSSQRKFSLASKKNMWEKIVEEESVKAKQTYRPTKKPFGITRAMSLQATSSFLDPNEEVNNVITKPRQVVNVHKQSNQQQNQQQQPLQPTTSTPTKTTSRRLSQNPAAMRFMSLDEESKQNDNNHIVGRGSTIHSGNSGSISNKRASITSTYTKAAAATAAPPTPINAGAGGFQYRERESATDRIRREIEEQKAREDELRNLGRIESLSEDTLDDLSVVSVSRCMSNDDEEEARNAGKEGEEEGDDDVMESEGPGTQRSLAPGISPTRGRGGGGLVPTQL